MQSILDLILREKGHAPVEHEDNITVNVEVCDLTSPKGRSRPLLALGVTSLRCRNPAALRGEAVMPTE